MDLTIEECEQLYSKYIGKEPCKHNFVDNVCINCGECKHNFVNNICINCGEETEGVINSERVFYTRSKQNTVLSLIDQRNLNLGDGFFYPRLRCTNKPWKKYLSIKATKVNTVCLHVYSIHENGNGLRRKIFLVLFRY